MTWKLTPYGKTRLPLVGIKWEDLTDEEYAAAVARHPGMEDQGYFDHVAEEEAPVSRRSHTAEEPPAAPPAEEETK